MCSTSDGARPARASARRMRVALPGRPVSMIVTRWSSNRKLELPSSETCMTSAVMRRRRTPLIAHPRASRSWTTFTRGRSLPCRCPVWQCTGTLCAMDDRYDVAVIGAGILGGSAAYWLACSGRRVLLIEAREPASGASGNSFSWLNAVSKEPEAYHRLNADGVAEYAGLAETLGVPLGLHGGGSLGWGGTAAEQAAIAERVERLAQRGYPALWVSRAEAMRLEPSLAIGEGVSGVAYHPGDGWVDAPQLVRALVNRALAEGADLWRTTPVRALRRFGDRVMAVMTERGDASVGQVLICAGTATPDLLATVGVALPVQRVPGLLAVTAPVAERPQRVVYAPGVHLRPDVDGGLRIGADDIDELATVETTPEDA